MTVLVTGGAGFIGANVVDRLLRSGETVRVLDNLSRPGVEKNVAWLQERHGTKLDLVVGDVRARSDVAAAMKDVTHVFHFAAQVAVTTSLIDPRADFDVNAGGTLNLLEVMRAQQRVPSLVYTSTNKVYGALEDIAFEACGPRYEPADPDIRMHGISEARPLQFHSPYGCSKGTADQYVLDYAHTFGFPAVVFRMSCIYGPRQFGNEDQGWVAHFLIRALRGETITIYGDGRQVRDILFIDDLVDAFLRVRSGISRLAGRVFNVGGGPRSAISLLELVDRLEVGGRKKPRLAFEPWRRADQRYYVSDTRALAQAAGWSPQVGVDEGIGRLLEWLSAQPENRPPPKRAAEAQP